MASPYIQLSRLDNRGTIITASLLLAPPPQLGPLAPISYQAFLSIPMATASVQALTPSSSQASRFPLWPVPHVVPGLSTPRTHPLLSPPRAPQCF